MKTFLNLTAALALVFGGQVAIAQQPTPELQALDDALPGTLINDPSRLDWTVFGAGESHKPVKGVAAPGGGALQITVPKAGNTLYEIGANAPLSGDIKKGSPIVIAFHARAIKSATPDGKGRIGVRVQRNEAPYGGFGDTLLAIDGEWAQYEVSLVADQDIPKSLAVVGFQLSGAKQVVEIGQMIVVSGVSTLKAKTTTVAGAPVSLPQLAGKGTLINDPANRALPVYGTGESHKTIPVGSLPGGSAIQFTVEAAKPNPYDIVVNVDVTEAIAQGDVLNIAILARSVSAETPTGAGTLGLRVQQNEAPYPGFGDNVVAVGPNWKLYQFKTQAKVDIAKGKGVVSLHLGGAKQVIELGQAYVFNAGPPQ
jgi:hypothetical protein